MAPKEATGAEPGVPHTSTATHLEPSSPKTEDRARKRVSCQDEGQQQGQDQNSEALAPSASWRGNHRRRGTLSPPFLEIHGTGGPQKPHGVHHHNRTPHQGRHGCRWRLAVAAAAHQTAPHRSPPPHLFPKTASSRRLRRQGRRRCPTKFGFSPGKQGGMGWGGQDLTGASKEVSGARGHRRRRASKAG